MLATDREIAEFKVKGTGLINNRSYFDEKIRPGYFDEKMKELDPTSRSLLLPSTWYGAYYQMRLCELAAKELNWDLKKLCYDLNEFNMKQSLTNMYTFFLKVGGPTLVLGKAPQMVKTFTNYLEYEMLRNEKGIHEAAVSSPKLLAEWDEHMVFGGLFGILKCLDRKVVSYKLLDKSAFGKDDLKWERRTVTIQYE